VGLSGKWLSKAGLKIFQKLEKAMFTLFSASFPVMRSKESFEVIFVGVREVSCFSGLRVL
jgi:hypothetical protein